MTTRSFTLRLHFYATDYLYFRHFRVLATSDGMRGWGQGFGVFVLQVEWKRVK